MKVIDLLNKIANGEKVPKKIKYDYKKFEFIGGAYEDEKGNDLCYYDDSCMVFLNDEVEIIEEEKKNNFTGWKMYQDGKEVCSMDCSVEEKKIPEKLENEHEFYSYAKYEENKNEIDKVLYILKAINLIEEKIGNLNNSVNEIIDYLKSKGE